MSSTTDDDSRHSSVGQQFFAVCIRQPLYQSEVNSIATMGKVICRRWVGKQKSGRISFEFRKGYFFLDEPAKLLPLRW